MFCPGCSLPVSDELKFCRRCGTNLRGVREAITSNSTGEKYDASQSWWTEMMSAAVEAKQRLSSTPEEKRLNEIKGGVITTLAGIGVMIFLRLFLGVIADQQSVPGDAEILRHVWLAGIIPFLVGIGLIFNGLFISRRLVKLKEQQAQTTLSAIPAPAALPAKTTDQLVHEAAPVANYSVIEDTTAHLPEPVVASPTRKTG